MNLSMLVLGCKQQLRVFKCDDVAVLLDNVVCAYCTVQECCVRKSLIVGLRLNKLKPKSKPKPEPEPSPKPNLNPNPRPKPISLIATSVRAP